MFCFSKIIRGCGVCVCSIAILCCFGAVAVNVANTSSDYTLASSHLSQNSLSTAVDSPINYDSSIADTFFIGTSVNLGGLFAVHLPDEDANGKTTCGILNEKSGLWIEGMLYAIDNVNKRDDMLPGVIIHGVIKDDCSDPNHALEQALSFLDDEEDTCCKDCKVPVPMIGVVGTGSSVTSTAVADLLGLFQVPQISYSATSEMLSDKKRFPFFLRTVASDINQAQVMADLAVYFDWNYVAIIHTKDDYGTPAAETLTAELKNLNVCIASLHEITRHSTDREIRHIISDLKDQTQVKVIFTFCLKHDISRILKEAVKQDMTGRTWVASDAWSNSDQVMRGKESVVKGMLGIVPKAGSDDQFISYLAQLKPDNNARNFWYRDTLQAGFKCSYMPSGPNIRKCHGNETFAEMVQGKMEAGWTAFVIDAVYAFAYGLHGYLECNYGNGEGKCNISKLSEHNSSAFLDDIKNVSFNGISTGGKKFYFQNDEPLANYAIYNLQVFGERSNFSEVGSWSPSSGLTLKEANIRWSTGSFPPMSRCSQDCYPGNYKVIKSPSCCWTCEPCEDNSVSSVVNSLSCDVCHDWEKSNPNQTQCIDLPLEYPSMSHPIIIVLNIITTIGLLATAIVFYIFVKHRMTPIVKATSVELSYCLLICIALCYANTFLILQKPSDGTCSAVVVMVGISFAAYVGTLLTKTNRIARIFNRKLSAGSPSFLAIKYQMLMIGGIVGLQTIIQVLWVWIEPGHMIFVRRDDYVQLECKYGSYAGPTITVGYVTILAMSCSYLAFRIRKLPGQFNDSKSIFFTMLTTCLIWCTFFPAYFASGNKWRLIVCSLAMIFNATVALSCVFIPKLWIILFRPERNRRESTLNLKEANKIHMNTPRNSITQNIISSSSCHADEDNSFDRILDDEETFQKRLEELQEELANAESEKTVTLSRVEELKIILEELEKACDTIHVL
ncbi:metabotropic glutamate receptor 3-like [Saccoglossus kowalevskii]|uniref:Metabotropic glutamate receptor 4-like n=1 Tax=Saccoglossus kowalevskii TaxID=10224 RepID=A0ABM0GYN8_SACKO|nr:PREDICTED: metabotropic glutamate receptor 4-like [Saccoglossus kowalevskii]